MIDFCFIPLQNLSINMRTRFPRHWDIVRRKVYSEAGHTCEICGNSYGKPLECHEVWEFKQGIQTLKNLQCVCYKCHAAIHLNQFITPTKFLQAIVLVKHIMTVNDWSFLMFAFQYLIHIRIWKAQSQLYYTFTYEAGEIERQYIKPVKISLKDR